jgi:hypothetical protein
VISYIGGGGYWGRGIWICDGWGEVGWGCFGDVAALTEALASAPVGERSRRCTGAPRILLFLS